MLLSATPAVGATRPTQPDRAPSVRTIPTPWLTILCKFVDHPETPEPPSFFEELMTTSGAARHNMADYFRAMSYGRAELTGSKVVGWIPMPYRNSDTTRYEWNGTVAQAFAARDQAVSDCIESAAKYRSEEYPKGIRFTGYYGLALMFNAGPGPNNDTSGGVRQLMLNGQEKQYAVAEIGFNSWRNQGVVAQEMLHGYGLPHSRSDDPSTDADGNALPYTEYGDRYDVMSCASCDTEFDYSRPYDAPLRDVRLGPSLNMGFRDRLGWVPSSRIVTASLCDLYQAPLTVQLAGADNPPGEHGALLAKVSVSDGDYYTVEFRNDNPYDRIHSALVRRVLPDGHTYVVNGQLGPEYFMDSQIQVQVTRNASDNYQSIFVTIGRSPTPEVPDCPVPITASA